MGEDPGEGGGEWDGVVVVEVVECSDVVDEDDEGSAKMLSRLITGGLIERDVRIGDLRRGCVGGFMALSMGSVSISVIRSAIIG